jgi:hypothetical protein
MTNQIRMASQQDRERLSNNQLALLKPQSALRDPAVASRVRSMMAVA